MSDDQGSRSLHGLHVMTLMKLILYTSVINGLGRRSSTLGRRALDSNAECVALGSLHGDGVVSLFRKGGLPPSRWD